MSTTTFTTAERKYIALIGKSACIAAYNEHMGGNGGNTIGDGYSYDANKAFELAGSSERITPSRYTTFGDCIINAGRKLCEMGQTPFQIAMQQAEAGTLQTPSVSTGGKPVDYFSYQLNVHLFNLKVMSKGMKFKGIGFKQIKEYYGFIGKSAADCVPEMEQVILDYATRSLTN